VTVEQYDDNEDAELETENVEYKEESMRTAC
jgi:hypothetical protein